MGVDRPDPTTHDSDSAAGGGNLVITCDGSIRFIDESGKHTYETIPS